MSEDIVDCELSVIHGNKLTGRIIRHSNSTESITVNVKLDNKDFAIRQIYFKTESDCCVTGEFVCEFPRYVLDGASHVAEVVFDKVITVNGQNHIEFSSNYVGVIENITNRKVSGWVANLSAPSLPVAIDAYVNGKHVAIDKAIYLKPERMINGIQVGPKIGFDIDLPIQSAVNSTINVELKVSGTNARLFYQSHVFTSYDTVLRSLELCNQFLNRLSYGIDVAGIKMNSLETRWLREGFIQPVIQEMRKLKSIPETLQINLSPFVQHNNSEVSSIIDIIIPVYKGKEETLECIQSVMRATYETQYELIVINDASPEHGLVEELKRLASAGKITLIHNQKNQGFVKSVNIGMRKNKNHDVVLLNSDTVVPDNWLSRMIEAAYSDENIGTVTPFTNAGTICSFPEMNVDANLPESYSLQKLDDLFHKMEMKTVDLPTAVGFCMYIKRKTLDEIGLFDEERWKKGYGEENDFCLRAGSMGWRSVIATNLFVQHHGSVSFSSNKQQLISENLPKLHHLYPDYKSRVDRFIRADPLAKYRTRVIKELLKEKSNQYMLFIIHGLGGGAGHAANVLAEKLIAEGNSLLIMRRLNDSSCEIKCSASGYRLLYEYPNEYEQLIEDIKYLGIWHVHYHQTMDFSIEILNLATSIGASYDFSAHDYLPICPQFNFVDETGKFCQNSRFNANTCDKCIQINGLIKGPREQYVELGRSVEQWRKIHFSFLQGARKIISPSVDTKIHYLEHINLDNVIVKQHPEGAFNLKDKVCKPITHKEQITVLVIGAIGVHKGYNVLMNCAKQALKDLLNIRFVVVGHTHDDDLIKELPNVEVTGEYKLEELSFLIAQYGAKVSLFLNTWPETFSYTLTEAWFNGLYPIAFDIGAIAERIKEVGYGKLIDPESSTVKINQEIIEAIYTAIDVPDITLGKQYDSMLDDYYEFNIEKSL